MARKERDGENGSESAKGRSNPKQRKPVNKGCKRSCKDLVNHQQMKALSKRERVRILSIFTERVASPKEISEELDENLSAVSYHVSVLRECRLILEDHKAPRRGAVEHFYRAAEATLVPPDAWDNLPPAPRKAISASILQEFFDDASAAMEAGVFDDPPGELSWTPLILDSPGIEDVGRLARDFLKAVLEAQAEASKRLQGGTEEATSATVFLASFLSARSPKDGKKASATKRR